MTRSVYEPRLQGLDNPQSGGIFAIYPKYTGGEKFVGNKCHNLFELITKY